MNHELSGTAFPSAVTLGNKLPKTAQLNKPARANTTKRLFSGIIQVDQVANGYTVNISSQEGSVYDTHVAHTIAEVNEIIAAQMVAFKLENA